MKSFKKFIWVISIPVLLVIGTSILLPAYATETLNNNMIKMTTSLGDIDIEMYPEQAPETVKNFINYVQSDHFDGLIFHRVIPGFMVQGGGFTPDMNQRETRAPIVNEADNGLKNTAGTLSMARTSVVDSATSQFFISLVDNAFLDFTAKTQQGWGYAVFAKVVNGMDVVKKIGAVATGNVGGHGDVPLEAILIEKVEVISE